MGREVPSMQRSIMLLAVALGMAGTTTDRRARFWRIGGAFLLVLVLTVLLFAAPADAQPRIKVHCEVYATNYVDPIAFADHLHHHFGNTSTSNASTGESLLAAGSGTTSCDMPWFTTAGWFPVERYEAVSGVNIYYRAPGDQRAVADIPTGLQLLGTRQFYRCNNTSGEEPFQATPPYRCRTAWGSRVLMPSCWNGWSLEETATVYSPTRSTCPSSHPIRLPEINFLIMHGAGDGVIRWPLQVSAGVDAWEDWPAMHADYFAANQPVFNNELLDLCLRDAPDRVTVADPRCGRGR
jgi:uncharacterized protein DUF1996